jgi:hypothetical protein
MKVISEGIVAAEQGLGPVVDAISGMRRGGYKGGEREILNNSRQ